MGMRTVETGVRHRTSTGGIGAVLIGVLLVAAMVATAGPAWAAETVVGDRLAGEHRYATAAEIALATHPDGADTVLLASGRTFPDALAAGGLAGLLDAPILLTAPDALPVETVDALDTLGADTVYVLGGDAAVSDAVVQAVTAPTVERVAGANRYATAAEIADRMGSAIGTIGGRRTAVIATGLNFPDALALGPVAYRLGLPVLLTRESRVPDQTVAALEAHGIEQVIVAGGTAVVDDAVEARLEEIVGSDVIRLAGVDRHETAALVGDFATRFLDFPGTTAVLASGGTFADAIAAAPYAGSVGAPVLLTEPGVLPESLTGYLLLNDGVVEEIVAAGGRQAVSQDVLDEAVATATSDPAAEIATVDLSFMNVVGDDGAFISGQPEGLGTAVLKLSPGKGTIAYVLDAAAVSPPFTDAPGAHIHRGPIDQSGPIVAPLATGAELERGLGGVSGFVREEAFTEPSVSVADIVADLDSFYVNVHSEDYPAGAVRGQLPDGGQTAVAEAIGDLTFALDAAHELTVDEDTGAVDYGASTEPGTGQVTLDFDLAGGTVTYRLDVSGVQGDLAGGAGAHIHEGFIDQNGPIVVSLATGPELAEAPEGVVTGTFDAGDFTDDFPTLSVREMFTAAADFYVNVHTTENPGGAVRGQLPQGGQLP